jgi:hypothetical protein
MSPQIVIVTAPATGIAPRRVVPVPGLAASSRVPAQRIQQRGQCNSAATTADAEP